MRAVHRAHATALPACVTRFVTAVGTGLADRVVLTARILSDSTRLLGWHAGVEQNIAEEASAHAGGLDALVNNAGIDLTTGIDTLVVEDFDRILRTNLRGPFLLAKFALPLLRERRGDIVNVTSTAAKRGWANASAYHASKWGLLGRSYALQPSCAGRTCA